MVDSTGNRRYWVVPIGVKDIDLTQLKNERDGIWAGAVKAYRNGEHWWLSNDEENLSADNNSKFQIIDEWQSAIAPYLMHREQVSITEILQNIFDFELGKIERRDQMRVANILTNLNWKKAGQRNYQGKRQVVWIPIPSPELPGIDEVLQPETSTESGLSIPTIPSTPNVNSKNELALEKDNPEQKKDTLPGVEVKPNLPERPSQGNNQAAIPWSSYPYQSKDIYTLKNRGEKVRERLNMSTTNGELIVLYAQGLISAKEVDWLKSNLLSQLECAHLEAAEATEQTNFFNQDEIKDLKVQTTREIRRIGWTKKQGIKYINENYGVCNRNQMSVSQLMEFRDYLRNETTKRT